MATIEIRDVLDNETGETIFPRTHVKAVIGLADSNFFEEYTDGNGVRSVRLRSEFAGLWAEGWIAAGGIGSGGGGGGGSYSAGTGIDITNSTISLKTSTALAIGGLKVGSVITTPTIEAISSTSGRYYYVQCDSNGLAFVNVPWVSGGGGGGGGSVNGITVGGTSYSPDANGIVALPAYPTTLPASDVYSWAKQSTKPSYTFSEIGSTPTTLSGYGITDAASSSDLTSLASRVTSIEGWFEVVNVAASGETPVYALHAKSGYAIYSDSWIAAGGIGSGSGGGGGSYTAGTGIDISSNTISLKTATASAIGGLKVYSVISTPTINTPSTTSGKYYYVQCDSNGLAFVNVPWSGGGGGGDYIPLSGSTSITGTLGASGWDITTAGVGEFDTLQGKGSGSSAKLKIGHSANSAYVWLQEDTYLAAAGLSGGTSTSSSSSPKWSIDKNGAAEFASVAVTGGTSSGFLKANGTIDTTTYLTSSWAGSSSITTLGTISTGTWNGTAIGVTYGGTGLSSISKGAILYASASNTLSALSANGTSTKKFLSQTSNNAPSWGVLADTDIPDISGTYVGLLGTQTIDGAKTFSTNPVTIDSTSGLSVATYIDIGDARLVYDSGAKALHVQNKTGVSDTIGFFADGFVAAGGTAAQTTISFVTLTGAQTVGGAKTWSGAATFSSTLTVNGVTLTGSSTKLSISKNTEFSGISNVTGGKVTIQSLADQIIALGGSL